MQIEKVKNGYIVREYSPLDETRIFRTLDEVFEEMLMEFEGRCDTFGGDSYGKVIVERMHP
jgi:hypothetical protein